MSGDVKWKQDYERDFDRLFQDALKAQAKVVTLRTRLATAEAALEDILHVKGFYREAYRRMRAIAEAALKLDDD